MECVCGILKNICMGAFLYENEVLKYPQQSPPPDG